MLTHRIVSSYSKYHSLLEGMAIVEFEQEEGELELISQVVKSGVLIMGEGFDRPYTGDWYPTKFSKSVFDPPSIPPKRVDNTIWDATRGMWTSR